MFYTIRMRYLVTFVFLIFIFDTNSFENYSNENSLIPIQKKHLQMIVEIPAGTNKKIEYNKITDEFSAEIINGNERYVKFLPYIGNYGFIPYTEMYKNDGGDGDAIDVLLISESIPTGSLVDIVPIAILNLLDSGEKDSKIIAVPLDREKKIIDISSYKELDTDFKRVKEIIEIWFLSYKGPEKVIFINWGDEKDAFYEILKYQTQK